MKGVYVYLSVLQMETPEVVVNAVSNKNIARPDDAEKDLLHILQSRCDTVQLCCGYTTVHGVVVLDPGQRFD